MSVFQSDFVLRLPAYLYVCATVFSADGASAEFSITPYLVNRVRGLALTYFLIAYLPERRLFMTSATSFAIASI